MFSRLPESKPQRQKRGAGFVVSTGLHAILIALAVRATTLTATPPEPPTVTRLVFFPRVVEPQTPQPSATPNVPRSSSGATTVPPAVPLVAPIDIPVTIPEPGAGPVVLSETGLDRAFDPKGRVSSGGGSGPPNASGDQPLTEPFVDQAVVALPGSSPRYPSLLQSAGVEGDVRAQFVVDTLGRVEPASVRILESTHENFAQAVRDALGRARFVPAKAGGRKVRQLVEQPFSFKLTTR